MRDRCENASRQALSEKGFAASGALETVHIIGAQFRGVAATQTATFQQPPVQNSLPEAVILLIPIMQSCCDAGWTVAQSARCYRPMLLCKKCDKALDLRIGHERARPSRLGMV